MKRQRVESGKQRTKGSQHTSSPIPVPTKINREWCEWESERSKRKSEPVSITKNEGCEWYEWWESESTDPSDQSAEVQNYEAPRTRQLNIIGVFCFLVNDIKFFSFLNARQMPQSQCHKTSTVQITSLSHRASTRQKRNYQKGRSQTVKDNSYSGRRKRQINISQREDVEIRRLNCCSMFIDFAPQSYLRKYQSKWNVCFYVFLFAHIYSQ